MKVIGSRDLVNLLMQVNIKKNLIGLISSPVSLPLDHDFTDKKEIFQA